MWEIGTTVHRSGSLRPRPTPKRRREPARDEAILEWLGELKQRAVLARELSTAANVLIVANPVFGLDFAAVADIRSQIMAARRRGTAILLVSEDLDELMEMADRIIVIAGGQFVHETPAAQADRMEIGRYMAGHRVVEAA